MNTSYSALETFKTCPLKYKFQQIDKIKTPKSPEAVFGTLVHSTMKFIHDGNFLLPTQKEALNYFSSNWNSDIFNDETQERMAFAQGIKIIQDYYKKNDPTKTQIVDLESRFTIEIKNLENKESHIISGFIDRIDKTDEGYEIIDYKTSRKLPAQSMVDDNLQLFIYLLAMLKRYPDLENQLDKIQLSLHFLKHGVKLSTKIQPEILEKSTVSILDTISEIEKSDFPANVGPLCDWCGYQKICPMWKHKFKSEKLKVKSEKDNILKEYVELSEKIKSDKKRVAELGEQIFEIMEEEKSDRLFSDGKIVSKSIRKTYKYDEESLKRILKEIDKWESAVKIDSAKLKKVMETLPASVKKDIEKTRQENESISLTVKKDKGD